MSRKITMPKNAPKWLENDLGEQFTAERIKTPPRGREHA